jgi:16S rRNA (cytosine1402-N4)-methyltransferase
MRMDSREDLTAAEIVGSWPEADIADVLWRFGEERHSRRIARAIVRERDSIATTADLAEVVRRAMPPTQGRDRIHPATRTFQALRIAVNREMDVLTAGLNAAIERLSPGGRIVVIAYHSLEDRIVKQLFRERSTGCICPPRLPICCCGHVATLKIITRKLVTPSETEVAANPRARSARARAAERLHAA